MPLVAVMVRVEVPVGVELAVLTDRVVDPEPATEAGVKLESHPRQPSHAEIDGSGESVGGCHVHRIARAGCGSYGLGRGCG